MLKFHSPNDVKLMLMEMGKDPNTGASDADKSNFVKRRSHVGTLYTNFRKSSQGKLNWIRNRVSMMKGIKDYANSHDSKKFHRQLGRWLATKEILPKEGLLGRRQEEELKLLLNQELDYYLPLSEQLLILDILEAIDEI